MNTVKRWPDKLMFSLFKKEASYDAAVTVSAANFCSMKGFEAEVLDIGDEIVTDKDEVTGQEFGTIQEIKSKAVKMTYKEPKAKPNSITGFMALALGSLTATQDGILVAYKHKGSPVAVGTALPSINAIYSEGGIQRLLKGLKCDSLKLSSKAGDYVSLEAALIGSGTRATNADSFVASITESWIKAAHAKAWYEKDSSISISAALVQHAEDISSGTPVDIKAKLQNFDFTFKNNPEGQFGHGSEVFADIDYKRREAELKATLLFADATEHDLFDNQNKLAVEFDFKGALIAVGGTMYYGYQLIVPLAYLKSAPRPKGGIGDALSIDLDFNIYNDGTNAPIIFEGYTAQAAYLA